MWTLSNGAKDTPLDGGKGHDGISTNRKCQYTVFRKTDVGNRRVSVSPLTKCYKVNKYYFVFNNNFVSWIY